MSIINDALKKTQQKRKMEKDKRGQVPSQPSSAVTPPPPPKPTLQTQPIEKKAEPVRKSDFMFTWKMASFLTVAALLVIMALSNSQRVKEVSAPIMQAATQPLEKVKVAFEGVFMFNNARIALINKKSLHLGDTVNGMKIVAINQDTVDLLGDNGTIQLRAGATYLL